MKRIIAITLALLVVGCSGAAWKNLLHSGASTWLECHDADGKPIYAEDDESAEAVKCREAFGEE